jgi:GH15 family glucan-1,4-alpha-glucosidase
MPRALVLANGHFMVCLDTFGFVRDVYFPYVGSENHVAGRSHKIGVWVDNQFSWLDDGSWEISLGYKQQTMIGYLVCKNATLNLSLVMEDAVYNESAVFLREISVYNHTDQPREVRLFFHQVFMMAENQKRNTAFYDPTHNTIVHYRGRRVMVVNARCEGGNPISEFAVGAYGFEGKEGTFRDAEDGHLEGNAVEHGSVDSVVSLKLQCPPRERCMAYYWFTAGKSLEEAYSLNSMVLEKTPGGMVHSTEKYWEAWLNKSAFHLGFLTAEQKKLFDTSLFILRSHTDNGGGIIASADSAMIEYGKDDYSYVWPRDAAYIASVLDKAGFTEATKPFFEFCRQVMHPDGYLHHRYLPDQSLGSTWHSTLAQEVWLKDKLLQLPIQEDETASVIVALWKHYQVTKDVELIENLYKPFVEPAAEFLVSFRNAETGLPLASYDLWEEKIGISTYTCASVYGGLQAAAEICELLGKRDHMRRYRDVAKELKTATLKHLFDKELGSFVRTARMVDGQLELERVVDASSLFGVWYFGLCQPGEVELEQTVAAVQLRLANPGATGGVIRYERDAYFRDGQLPNPWFITTLWEVQRRLSSPAVTLQDLEFARNTFQWVTDHLYPSGVLAEQLRPERNESISATPLAWSHAVFVETVLQYSEAAHRVGVCEECKHE